MRLSYAFGIGPRNRQSSVDTEVTEGIQSKRMRLLSVRGRKHKPEGNQVMHEPPSGSSTTCKCPKLEIIVIDDLPALDICTPHRQHPRRR